MRVKRERDRPLDHCTRLSASPRSCRWRYRLRLLETIEGEKQPLSHSPSFSQLTADSPHTHTQMSDSVNKSPHPDHDQQQLVMEERIPLTTDSSPPPKQVPSLVSERRQICFSEKRQLWCRRRGVRRRIMWYVITCDTPSQSFERPSCAQPSPPQPFDQKCGCGKRLQQQPASAAPIAPAACAAAPVQQSQRRSRRCTNGHRCTGSSRIRRRGI